MVRTGASSYIRYGWESTFGAAPTLSTLDKAFGLNARLTNWDLTNSPKDLPTLGQVEVKDYAFGQQTGSMGVDFVLSNPWIFGAIYGIPAETGSAPYVYKYGTAAGVHATAKTVRSFTTEVGFEGETNTMVRRGLGCVANNLSLSTSIDGTVDCSMGISYGKEDTQTGGSGAGTVITSGFEASPPADDVAFPYTFAHGQLKWAGEGGVDTTHATDSIVAELQDASINFSQNPTLLYTIGSHQSVASFRRVFDITGSFTASWKNDDKLNQLLDQVRKPLTKSTISLSAAPEILLTFTNGGTGATLKEIQFKLHGVRPDSHAVSGIQPVEPVFENIAWRTKTCEIVCSNQTNRADPW
jgi:hypothetical protein